MQSVQFRMLGGLEVHDGGRPVDLGGPKQRAVLAALLLEPGRPHAPIRLIDEVWHDSAPRSAEVSLQAYISNLRRVLEPDRWLGDRHAHEGPSGRRRDRDGRRPAG